MSFCGGAEQGDAAEACAGDRRVVEGVLGRAECCESGLSVPGGVGEVVDEDAGGDVDLLGTHCYEQVP